MKGCDELQPGRDDKSVRIRHSAFANHIARTIVISVVDTFLSTDETGGGAEHELLCMDKVLSHLINSAQPLIQVRAYVAINSKLAHPPPCPPPP